MIDVRCASAPAGVSAWGALLVRPAAGDAVLMARPRHAVVRSTTPFDLTGTAVAAPAAPFQGTGLPIAGQPVFGTGLVGGADALTEDTTHTRHTLGIHSPGRPQS
ncbi:hypothetical protein JD79_02173 [Geodermatophilus normandii]|uniref:Uncharacterized protein n=1 Tax=Geodermatophilus normandii TaxID=1137989 RepID=A0A317QN32_9ACTN|nr:hypothetical protein [Geodermatophilus normandii]PWW23010.1 hypothetical protein JD79_02173 [Geodermatophilus normandii]